MVKISDRVARVMDDELGTTPVQLSRTHTAAPAFTIAAFACLELPVMFGAIEFCIRPSRATAASLPMTAGNAKKLDGVLLLWSLWDRGIALVESTGDHA
jgi:hypothetical protein